MTIWSLPKISRLLAVLTVFAVVLVCSLGVNAKSCEGLFRPSKEVIYAKRIDDYRREIYLAARDYADSDKLTELSRNTAQLGGEGTRFLLSRSGSSKNRKQSHVVMLDHGADVFRVLHDFPEATHFHSVDSLMMWGSMKPIQIIQEMSARLHAIAPDAKVELLQRGLEGMTDEDLKGTLYEAPVTKEISSIYFDHIRALENLAKPYVWKVTWISPSLGAQEKFFYLQAFNHHKPELINQFVHELPAHAVLEALVFSKSRYSAEFVTPLLNRLVSSGAVVWQHRIRLEDYNAIHAGEYRPGDKTLASVLESNLVKKMGSFYEYDHGIDKSKPWLTYVLQKH